jgi:hypothetical protein
VAAAWISVIRNNILKIHSVLAIHSKAVLGNFVILERSQTLMGLAPNVVPFHDGIVCEY